MAIYIDQRSPGPPLESTPPDIGAALAAEHGVPVYSSIQQALCRGGGELAVDGVLLIGEHGALNNG